MRIKHQRRPATATRNPANNPPCLRAIHLDTREVWLREHLVERDLPGVDLEVHGDHAIGEEALDVNLTARARHTLGIRTSPARSVTICVVCSST
jgi:hypothetical protein